MKKARIILEDGTVMVGSSFGASDKDIYGEFVFNTSMTGYQEILTDPSYNGQIITMTFPLIGNYGVNEEDIESDDIQVRGFIVKENSQIYSNRRGSKSLSEYFSENGIVALENIDTRKLTRLLRINGAMRGMIAFGEETDTELIEKVNQSPKMEGQDLTKVVSTKTPYIVSSEGNAKYKIAAYDFGIKQNILRNLSSIGCEIKVFPSETSYQDLLDYNPDGIFLSNGPGDPEPVKTAQENIKALLGKKPIFGICLGHQLLSLSLGMKTYKLKFGHRGGNHPVMNFDTGLVEITSQNHGFAVSEEKIPDGVKITHQNLYDKTVEGIRCEDLKAFSVQYHPEAAPGPHDSRYLFKDFLNAIENFKD